LRKNMLCFKNCCTRSPKRRPTARYTSLNSDSPNDGFSETRVFPPSCYAPLPPPGSPLDRFANSGFNPEEERLKKPQSNVYMPPPTCWESLKNCCSWTKASPILPTPIPPPTSYSRSRQNAGWIGDPLLDPEEDDTVTW
jgi:hypothetical protein